MTIAKLPNGRWRARIWHDGRDRPVSQILGGGPASYQTKREAKAAYAKAIQPVTSTTRYAGLRFNGPDYQPERDNPRLGSQLERVKALMLDGEWRTLNQIAEATGDPVASISAQLRHLRKDRFGSYRVERRHLGQGLYEYRVLEPVGSFDERGQGVLV